MTCSKDECEADGGGDPALMMSSLNAPDDAHQKLGPFVGVWSAEIKFWCNPGQEPIVSTGIMLTEWILGGRWIEHRYRSDDSLFGGMGLMGFNTITGKYEGLWVDSTSTMMQFETGDYDPATNTFEMTSQVLCPQTRTPMLKRTVIGVESDDRHVMQVYFKSSSEPERKVMEVMYVRK